MSLSNESDFIDPADEDWPNMDGAELYWAAQAGVPEAVAEVKRRTGAKP